MPQELQYTSIKDAFPDRWDAFIAECRNNELNIDIVSHEDTFSQITFHDYESWELAAVLRLEYFEPVQEHLEFTEWVDRLDTDGEEDEEGNLILTPQFRLFVSYVTLA